MIRWLARRLAWGVFVVWLVATATFYGTLRLGDPVPMFQLFLLLVPNVALATSAPLPARKPRRLTVDMREGTAGFVIVSLIAVGRSGGTGRGRQRGRVWWRRR